MTELLLGDNERNLKVDGEFDGEHLGVSVYHSNFGTARTIYLSKPEVHKLILHLNSLLEIKNINNEY